MKKCLVLFLPPLLWPVWLFAATVTHLQSGTENTWISVNTNIANNGQILSSAVTVTDSGYLFAYCTLNVPAWSGTVTAGSGVKVWLIVSTDAGTTYEDGDASTTPARLPDMDFPLRAVSTAQIVGFRLDKMPIGTFKVLARNDGTGVSMNGATTIWTIKCKPYTYQVN